MERKVSHFSPQDQVNQFVSFTRQEQLHPISKEESQQLKEKEKSMKNKGIREVREARFLKGQCIPFLVLTTLMFLVSLMTKNMGCSDYFETLLLKVGLRLALENLSLIFGRGWGSGIS